MTAGSLLFSLAGRYVKAIFLMDYINGLQALYYVCKQIASSYTLCIHRISNSSQCNAIHLENKARKHVKLMSMQFLMPIPAPCFLENVSFTIKISNLWIESKTMSPPSKVINITLSAISAALIGMRRWQPSSRLVRRCRRLCGCYTICWQRK